jgi:hypothetical protein
MRKKLIPSLMHDLIHLQEDFHPAGPLSVPNKTEINLLTGKINISERDSITDLLKEKREWFKKRIKKLNGKLSDFQSAKITIFGKKEKIQIKFKDEIFVKEVVY